jgi:hypothetical protein
MHYVIFYFHLFPIGIGLHLIQTIEFRMKNMLGSLIVLLILSCSTMDHRINGNRSQDKASGLSQKGENSEGWYAAMQKDLSLREYHISYDSLIGSYQSPNRKQNIRSYYAPGEWKLQNREAGHNWNVTLKTLGIYADGKQVASPGFTSSPALKSNSIEFRHKGFTEQYLNTEEGIRQNFIVHEAPAEARELRVILQLEGMKAREVSGTEIALYNEDQHLSYSGLKVWDAAGKELAAHMELQGQGLQLVVQAEYAKYPVTIDPIISNGTPANANAVFESNQISVYMGWSVSGAGDVNGDGYSDVIVSADQYDNGQTDEGTAFVYHGSASGISTTASTTLESNQANAHLGWSVSGAGDVNGDGYSDVIVGANTYDNGQTDEGAAFVYHGSASGISTTASATLETNQANAQFGSSVSGAGDVNGDGYSDVIVGAYRYTNGQSAEGVAFVYHGSASGISTTASATLESNQASAQLGISVSGAGDVNGDGYSDVIVGANLYDNGQTDEGAAFVYHGNAGGGLRRNLQLFNTGTVSPVSHSNTTSPRFAAGLFARSFEGRSKGKLVWQVKSQGNALPATNSTLFTGKQSTYSNLGTAGTRLSTDISKAGFQTKIRVRLQYDPVTSQNGEVYGPWIYPQGYFSAQGMSAAPLPVELISFTASVLDHKDVRLQWQTASEVNNDYFIVERSADGKTWEEVTKVKGQGNSNVMSSYSATDKEAYAGISYYRLKQTDFNGHYEYSAIRTVKVNSSGNVLIYPNPATDEIMLKANDAELQHLVIINQLGQEVTGRAHVKERNATALLLDISELPSGLYLVKTATQVSKIFKR